MVFYSIIIDQRLRFKSTRGSLQTTLLTLPYVQKHELGKHEDAGDPHPGRPTFGLILS